MKVSRYDWIPCRKELAKGRVLDLFFDFVLLETMLSKDNSKWLGVFSTLIKSLG